MSMLSEDDFEMLEVPEDPDKAFNVARVQSALAQVNGEVELVHITISKDNGSIDMERNSNIIRKASYRKYELRKKPGSPPTETEKELVDDPIEECLSLIQPLHAALPTTPFRFTLNLQGIKDGEMKNLVVRCLVVDYIKVTISGRYGREDALSHDEMDFLMDTIKPSAALELECGVPEGYMNEKAFQFSSVHYQHANWITLDSLKSIQNCDRVHLEATHLVNEDINQLLHYWTVSKVDMMRRFKVQLKKGTVYDEKKVLDKLPFATNKQFPKIRFIKTKIINKNRQLLLGKLEVNPDRIEFSCHKPPDSHFCQRIYNGLYDVQEQFDLMTEKSENLEEVEGYELILDDYEEGSEEKTWIRQEITRLEERRGVVESRLRGLERKIRMSGIESNTLKIGDVACSRPVHHSDY